MRMQQGHWVSLASLLVIFVSINTSDSFPFAPTSPEKWRQLIKSKTQNQRIPRVVIPQAQVSTNAVGGTSVQRSTVNVANVKKEESGVFAGLSKKIYNFLLPLAKTRLKDPNKIVAESEAAMEQQLGPSQGSSMTMGPSQSQSQGPSPGQSRKFSDSAGGANGAGETDRIFYTPQKFPFWGLPYGVYSNGGFFNPGLFPFVPGGVAFPPYDGIFGGPFFSDSSSAAVQAPVDPNATTTPSPSSPDNSTSSDTNSTNPYYNNYNNNNNNYNSNNNYNYNPMINYQNARTDPQRKPPTVQPDQNPYSYTYNQMNTVNSPPAVSNPYGNLPQTGQNMAVPYEAPALPPPYSPYSPSYQYPDPNLYPQPYSYPYSSQYPVNYPYSDNFAAAAAAASSSAENVDEQEPEKTEEELEEERQAKIRKWKKNKLKKMLQKMAKKLKSRRKSELQCCCEADADQENCRADCNCDGDSENVKNNNNDETNDGATENGGDQSNWLKKRSDDNALELQSEPEQDSESALDQESEAVQILMTTPLPQFQHSQQPSQLELEGQSQFQANPGPQPQNFRDEKQYGPGSGQRQSSSEYAQEYFPSSNDNNNGQSYNQNIAVSDNDQNSYYDSSNFPL